MENTTPTSPPIESNNTAPQVSTEEHVRRFRARQESLRIGTRGAFGGKTSKDKPRRCKR